MKTATSIQLTCPECQRGNEAERIYCHDCGARLDRSVLANRKTAKIETAEELHKRMRGMFSQRRIKARLALFKTVKILLAACVGGCPAGDFTSARCPASRENGHITAPD